MSAAHRSAIREAAVQTVFEALFREKTARWAELFLYNVQLFDLRQYDEEFAEQLITYAEQHTEDIRRLITELAPTWPWEQIHMLDRAILIIAVTELKYIGDASVGIVVNEYIEIAKNYGGDTTRRFVNGVLSSVIKSLQAG